MKQGSWVWSWNRGHTGSWNRDRYWYHMHLCQVMESHCIIVVWLLNCDYVILCDRCEFYPLSCIIHRYLLNVVLTPSFLVCCVCASSEVQIIQVLELYVECVLLDRVLGVALIRNTRLFWGTSFIGYNCWIFVTYRFQILIFEEPRFRWILFVGGKCAVKYFLIKLFPLYYWFLRKGWIK